jgi:primosomal protein N'
MQVRKISQYPPYTYLVALTFLGQSRRESGGLSSHDVKVDLDRHGFPGVQTLGPISPYYNFIDNYYFRSLLIKYKNSR